MALSSAEWYELILGALNYLQDDGGQFQRGLEKAALSRDELWLLYRFSYFPGSVAPSDFLTFGPYTSVSNYHKLIDLLTAKKYAEQVDAGRYRASEAGRKFIDVLYRDYFNAIAKHEGLHDDELARLGELTDRAVTSAVRQPDVPAPITSAARSAFPKTDQLWVYVERRIAAMALFHTDAHIAAWRDDGWSGPRIEVSTALFKAADRLSAADLRMATARLDDKDFNSAVAALHSGGELTHSPDDFYQLTKSGRAARQAVEDQTNRNYAVLFSALEPAEQAELNSLLIKVRGPA